MIKTPLVALVLLAGLLSLGGRAGFAERLVLRDGSVIETSGPWRVKGRQVLFTLPNGTLSSLRIDDVDLEASADSVQDAATDEAEGEAAERNDGARHREPVLVITDDDVARARSGAQVAEGDEEGSTEREAVQGPEEARPADGDGDVLFTADGLEVAGWRSLDSPRGGVEITGSLVNHGEHLVVDATIRMNATTADGTEATYTAIISNPTLGPGQRSPFRILLPDVYAVDDSVDFDIEGRAIRPRVAGFGAAADDEPEGDQR